MTTKRVIIDASLGAPSPLRVSVAGVDAALAEFNDLIFDGNQSPLRLWGTGFGTTSGFSFNDAHLGGQNMSEAVIAGGFVTPAGTTALFMTMWRRSDDTRNLLSTPSFDPSSNSGGRGGSGGGICSGTFIGACFNVGSPATPTLPAAGNYVNYCIFKQYN